MSLLTIEDVQSEAIIREVTLPENEISIQNRINLTQAYIQRTSGRIFTEKTFTESDSKYGIQIRLNHIPITEIIELKINDNVISADEYTLKADTGFIELNYSCNEIFKYTVTYKACEDESSDIYLLAQEIALDHFFAKFTSAGHENNIKSEKDLNYSVTYADKNALQTIEDRVINELKLYRADAI